MVYGLWFMVFGLWFSVYGYLIIKLLKLSQSLGNGAKVINSVILTDVRIHLKNSFLGH